jgi:hypothetical protein
MTRAAVGDLALAGLLALVLLLGALLWIEWPSGGGTPRVSMDIVSEILHDRQYDESTSQRSTAAEVLVARGSRVDHLPVIRLSNWKTWVDADKAVGVTDSRTLPVGSCRREQSPTRTTCVVAERLTASVAGAYLPALATLRHLASWLRFGGVSGAGYWDGRTR